MANSAQLVSSPRPNFIVDYPEDQDPDEPNEELFAFASPTRPSGLVDFAEPSYQFDLNANSSVPFQRVSSEDELNFYAKPRRAKFIGPYLFGDVIGQGSYAKVKECLDRRNLCRRAVKIMQRRRLRKTPHGEEMALTEIRLLKHLNHPNVIRLYDCLKNEEKQKLYLFIDLCVVSLQEMLDANEKRAFPLWQAHGYFVQLIHGLEYLQSKLIIHNDIK